MKTRPRNRRFERFAILLLAMAMLAAACGDDGGGNSADGGSGSGAGSDRDATEAAPSEVADRSAEFRFAIQFGFTALDPHQALQGADQLWLSPLYDRLLRIVEGADGVELGQQLATSFEVAADGLSINFELRDDVTFQDGTPFNGAAVKANIERAKGADSKVSSQFRTVAGVEVVDDTHVVFRLSEPDPTIPWRLATGTPGSMISPAAFGSDLLAKPVGTGPFTLVSAQKDADVVYQRWDGHWDKDAALVQRFTISTVPDPNARYNGLRSGTYDAAYVSPPQDLEAQTLEADGYHYDLQLFPGPFGVMLNATKPPFDDVRVRRAVSLAINRKEISETLFEGLGTPAYQTFGKGYPGYDDSLDEDPYDLEEARRLVKEAGAEGASVSLLTSTSPPSNALGEVVQQVLGDLGFKVDATPLSATEVRPAWGRGGHAAYVDGMSYPSPEPSQALSLSYLGLPDNPAPPPAELVQMANEAKALPLGSDAREEAYHEIARYLLENPVHVPIGRVWAVIVSQPKVVGVDTMMVVNITHFDIRGVGIAES